MKYLAVVKSGQGREEFTFEAANSFEAIREAAKIYREDGYEDVGYNDVLDVTVVPQSTPNKP